MHSAQSWCIRLRPPSPHKFPWIARKPSVFFLPTVAKARPDVLHRRMSEQTYGVGTTLAGGIQDIAALLPLLGTDQCEKHVGSALDGGYLYAAAAPLSIFGSLGIVKLGISVLISNISIPKLSVSFAFSPHPKLSMSFHGCRWLGARILDNAGFKPVGNVSSLIAMDGNRYKAETRLMEILKEKHMEDPERLSVEWKSTEWNIMLVICSMVAACCGVLPYIPFISPPYRSSALHSPWIFPLLRTVGSCIAAACCQFLIQSRVVSLMKNRLVFMIMDRTCGVKDLKADPGSLSQTAWDESLPSEECLWYLGRCVPRTQGETPEPDDTRTKLLDLQDKHLHFRLRSRPHPCLMDTSFSFSSSYSSWIYWLLHVG